MPPHHPTPTLSRDQHSGGERALRPLVCRIGLLLAAMMGALSVAAGAWGAHGAQGDAADWAKTGAVYGFSHAALVFALLNGRSAYRHAALFLLGAAMVFSGSLFILALGGPRGWGMITPFGGLGLILGWLWLGFTSLRS